MDCVLALGSRALCPWLSHLTSLSYFPHQYNEDIINMGGKNSESGGTKFLPIEDDFHFELYSEGHHTDVYYFTLPKGSFYDS